ncbi:TPA: ATP-binding cassette domain-containing protein [Streptococcus suis]|uniref:ABC transporter ATP-binding protein/permease n=1 Tax=Streptococcus suis TaxID=1307 RepID=UPI001C98241C|nr:ATP-binding cassette domain-containing protein [Streptococcus suis]MBY4990320.1 ATP-binding cassette domain-containing protein [Streptococcus suis]
MLEIDGIILRYGSRILLNETSLQFKRGNVYTISGPSGIGKSSLLNKIGLIATDLGDMSYSYDGHPLNLTDGEAVSNFIAQHIGFIFQEKNLIRQFSVYDNLALLVKSQSEADDLDDRVDECLKKLGLLDKKYTFPYDLSGGEEQRVAIARAIVTDKDIILADEPTNSLDKENREKITNLLVELAHHYQKIVIIVSHDDEVIKYGDVHIRFLDQRIEQEEKNTFKKEGARDIYNLSIKQKIDLPKRKFPISKIVTGLLIFFVALSSMMFNITGLFQSHYQQLLDNSLENGFLVMNDNLGIKGKQVYDDFLSFTTDEVEFLADSVAILNVTPYLEFPYQGLTFENPEQSTQQINPEITLNGKTITLSSPYSIQPLFQTNMTERNIEYIDRTTKQGLIVSESFIATQNLSSELGTFPRITLDYYVPVALYEGEMTTDTGEILDSDGNIYVKQRREFKIIGILKNSYPFQYSIYGNSFFMMADEMLHLQQELQQDEELPEVLGGLSVSSWQSSAYHIKIKNSTAVSEEIDRIKQLPSVTIVSSAEDYQSLKDILAYVRKVSTYIGLVILLLMGLCLFFVFFPSE